MGHEIADIVSIIYFLTALVATYGFVLFATWWRVRGSASTVYKYVTFLLLGSSIQFWLALKSRGMVLDGDYSGLSAWWWNWRCVVSFVFISAIVGHMSYRVFWQRKHPKQYAERRGVE